MKRLFKMFNFFLLIIAIILSFLIFKNKSLNFGKLNTIFHSMTNFINIGKNQNIVSNTIDFIKIENYKYYNESFSIYSPFNATVIDKSDCTITIKCENGYFATYSNLVQVSVNKYDVITPNDKLGLFADYFEFYFFDDEKRYSYEEIMWFN